MYESPVLAESEIPQIALDSMNDTHHEEVALVNRLGVLLEDGMKGKVNTELITDKLADWVEHTHEHFESENQLMQDYGFPAFPVHAAEHQRVLEQIDLLQQQWLDTKEVQPLAEFVFNEWPLWFDNHVNTMDLVTSQYLSQVMK